MPRARPTYVQQLRHLVVAADADDETAIEAKCFLLSLGRGELDHLPVGVLRTRANSYVTLLEHAKGKPTQRIETSGDLEISMRERMAEARNRARRRTTAPVDATPDEE